MLFFLAIRWSEPARPVRNSLRGACVQLMLDYVSRQYLISSHISGTSQDASHRTHRRTRRLKRPLTYTADRVSHLTPGAGGSGPIAGRIASDAPLDAPTHLSRACPRSIEPTTSDPPQVRVNASPGAPPRSHRRTHHHPPRRSHRCSVLLSGRTPLSHSAMGETRRRATIAAFGVWKSGTLGEFVSLP